MAPLPPPLQPNLADWIVEVNEGLKHMTSDEQQYWKKSSIYRVPPTDLNDEAYRPQTVSFGPYHNGKEHLRPMEKHKRRALLHFLKRSGKPLETFLESLRKVARDLEKSYEALDPEWKAGSSEGAADRFLQLMITDGCFMLETLRTMTRQVDDYAPNDPIFSYHEMLYTYPSIRRDMLMLENQLPMLVLDQLVTVESDGKTDDEFVNGLILKFCCPGTRITRMGKCMHVLDVFRKSMLRESKRVQYHMENFREVYTEKNFLSATELDEAGIQFKKSKTNSLVDISFDNGILRLPSIEVDDTTESMFLNLMAFERLQPGAGYDVTSYIFFMDIIINNEQDIALLHTKGILQNGLETYQAAAELFNSLNKHVILDPNSRLHYVLKKVSKYHRNPWNVWRANLIHTYFRNPWVLLSLTAAVLLIALTIIQTVYAVLSYDK